MSGRKVATITLDEALQQELRSRTAADDALTRARSLLAALVAQADQAPAFSERVPEIQRGFDDIQRSWPTDGEALRSVSSAQSRRNTFENLTSRLRTIANDCRRELRLAEVRFTLSALLAEVEARAPELRPWLGDGWNDFAGRVRARLRKLDARIARGRGPATDGTAVDDLAAELDRLLERAAADRQRAAERRHVADAIEQVCAEMGFAATLKPPSAPTDDLVVTVETHAYGLIEIRLALDLTWRSESSGLTTRDCGRTFPLIEGKLRGLGVRSPFRYEADDRPVDSARDARSLPGTAPAAAAMERRA